MNCSANEPDLDEVVDVGIQLSRSVRLEAIPAVEGARPGVVFCDPELSRLRSQYGIE
jgi:hypothetical protein